MIHPQTAAPTRAAGSRPSAIPARRPPAPRGVPAHAHSHYRAHPHSGPYAGLNTCHSRPSRPDRKPVGAAHGTSPALPKAPFTSPVPASRRRLTSVAAGSTSADTTQQAQVDLQEAYAHCSEVTEEYAKTFFLAARFLSPERARAIHALYAWCRQLDEVVDGATESDSPRQVRARLDAWSARLQEGSAEDSAGADQGPGGEQGAGEAEPAVDGDPRMWAAFEDTLRSTDGFSKQPFLDMIDGMRSDVPAQDTAQEVAVQMADWPQLERYCYNVAGTVGVMTLPVLGTDSSVSVAEATPGAVALGMALQLVNILRDVGEDARRGRVYLPRDSLDQWEVSVEDILAASSPALSSSSPAPPGHLSRSPAYRQVIEELIQRALWYFAVGEAAIPMLPPAARPPVRLAARLYKEILFRVRANGYDNLTRRAYTTKWEKLRLVPRVLLEDAGEPPAWVGEPIPPGSPFPADLEALLALRAAAVVQEPGAGEGEGVMGAVLERVLPQNPTAAPARDGALLQGRWELVWSSPGSDYARLRARLDALPGAPASRSLQVVRAAGALTQNVILLGPLQVVIEATTQADDAEGDPEGQRTLVGPPYTFTLRVGPLRLPLQFPPEFGQERTSVDQQYLSGRLRVSRVGAYGDRTTPGSSFVHVRLGDAADG